MRQPPLFSWQRAWRLVAAVAIAAFLVIFGAMPLPVLGVLPPCTFKNLTGLPCALCGGTRSAHALLQGNISSALYLNPLSLVAVALLAILSLLLLWEALAGRALTNWAALPAHVRPWMLLSLAGLLLLWWAPHLLIAIKTPKKELVDLRNPIAATLYRQLHGKPSP